MNEQLPPAPESTTSSWLRVVVAIAVLIAGAVGILVLLRAPTANRDYARTVRCASNLKTLAVAIAEYASEHDGKLPKKLEDLSRYNAPDRLFFCPSAKDQAHYSYVLMGATNVWGIGGDIPIVLEIQPNHYGKRHVLYDDGHVELKAPSDL